MSVGDQHSIYDINAKVFDEAIDALDSKGVVFNTNYDIPYLAGTNWDDTVIYRDKSTPSGYHSTSGKWVDTDKYFMLHERIEKALLQEGFVYLLAHQCATQLEYAAVKSDGHDVEEYDNKTQEMVQKAGERLSYQVPVDLCLTPYIDCKDQETISRMHGLPDTEIEAVAKKIR